MSHAGLWLPPQFLAGDPDTTLSNSDFSFPSEFPYEFGLSSPESSDDGEEDFFAGLSRRLGQTSLHETRKQLSSTVSEIPRKTQGLVGSPQSTLAGIGSWSGRSAVSGDGSPNGYSRVPSPSTTPFDENNDPWEVIYAAAVQIARMKMNNNNNRVPAQYDFHNNRRLLTHHCPNRSFNQVILVKDSEIQLIYSILILSLVDVGFLTIFVCCFCRSRERSNSVVRIGEGQPSLITIWFSSNRLRFRVERVSLGTRV